jgi:hypothetical protein
MIYQWLDNLDSWYYSLSPKGEVMFDKLIKAIVWTWDKMTLVSVLLIIVMLAIACLIWMGLYDRKKFGSKRWHAGYKAGKEDVK